jgi:hypothetical protein
MRKYDRILNQPIKGKTLIQSPCETTAQIQIKFLITP